MGTDARGFGPGASRFEAANLRALLCSGGLDGLRLWPGAPDPETVRIAARDEGWASRDLDCEGVDTKADYLARCARTFDFPDYFGGNWDALEECLADVGDTDAEGLLVVWHSWQHMALESPKAFATALDIWRSTVDSWEAQGDRAGVVLLSESPTIPDELEVALGDLPQVPA